jgi:4-diphosphocytidyl-2-C-methyl-D-erythritol kinase
MDAFISHSTRTETVEGRITMAPPAKINLSLLVQAKREDGYHALHSIIATISLKDRLTLAATTTGGIRFSTTGIDTPAGHDNIVTKAAQLIANHCDQPINVQITLEKNIPTGAGLGGGSSDAASCLMGLNKLFSLNIPLSQLAIMAAQLGCDVPFFLYGPVAQCTGCGEIVTPLTARCHLNILLITPQIEIPTHLIFKHFKPNKIQTEKQLQEIETHITNHQLNALAQMGYNNLTATCMAQFEQLDTLKKELAAQNVGPIFLSGSGSSLYVLSSARVVLEEMKKKVHKLGCNAQIVHFLQS